MLSMLQVSEEVYYYDAIIFLEHSILLNMCAFGNIPSTKPFSNKANGPYFVGIVDKNNVAEGAREGGIIKSE